MFKRLFIATIFFLTTAFAITTCSSRDDTQSCENTPPYVPCANIQHCDDYYGILGDSDILQKVPANGGKDVELFEIDNEYYFATANQYSYTTGYETTSDIYKWNTATNDGFTLIQNIATVDSLDVEFETFNSIHYLFITNGDPAGLPSQNTRVYTWDGSQFNYLQDLESTTSYGVETFVLDNKLYAAVADTYTNHKIYLYRLDSGTFSLYQTLDANTPVDAKHIFDGIDHYLLVANGREGTNFNTNSYLYIWENNQFVKWQDIATSNAEDWDSVNTGGVIYVLGANLRTGGAPDFTVNHPIYRLVNKKLSTFQSIQTVGARDIHGFTSGTSAYFAISQAGNGETTYLRSPILKFQDNDFCMYTEVLVYGAANMKHFKIGNIEYLYVVQNGDPNRPQQTFDAIIYKWPG